MHCDKSRLSLCSIALQIGSCSTELSKRPEGHYSSKHWRWLSRAAKPKLNFLHFLFAVTRSFCVFLAKEICTTHHNLILSLSLAAGGVCSAWQPLSCCCGSVYREGSGGGVSVKTTHSAACLCIIIIISIAVMHTVFTCCDRLLLWLCNVGASPWTSWMTAIRVSVYCKFVVPPGMCEAGFHMCRSAHFFYCLFWGVFLLLLGKWFLHNSCATIRLKPFLHCQQLFSRDCVTFWRCMRSFLRSGPASQVYGSCTEKNKTLCRNACVAAGQAHSSEPEISRSLQADHVQLPLLLFNKWGVPSALPLKYSVFTILKWPFTPAVSAEQRQTSLFQLHSGPKAIWP